MKKDKEMAKEDFVEMIKKSWTFDRMTDKEKSDCLLMFNLATTDMALKGDYLHRWRILQALYDSFLTALCYYDNCADWRGEQLGVIR